MPNKFVRVCPKCLSRNIESDLSAEAYGASNFFNSYKCNDCQYAGQFFPELPESEWKKMKKGKVSE